MKLLNSIIACAVMFATTNVIAQDADEIMKKHEQAIGGAKSWDKINTMVLKGNISQSGMDIPIVQTIMIGKAMRTDITFMGKSGFRILTTTEGWQYLPFMGAAKLDTMKPDMVAKSQKQLSIKEQQMMDYKAKGIKIEYIGKDTVSSFACHKLKFIDKNGDESFAYIDCENYYLMRSETKIKKDDEEQEVAVIFKNYKKFDDGIVFPMIINAEGVDVVFSSIDINKPVDESIFKPNLPADAATESEKK